MKKLSTLLFSFLFIVLTTPRASAQPNRITYSWPDSQYEFEIFYDGGSAGLVVKSPSESNPSEFDAVKINRSRPYVISAVPADIQLSHDQVSLGRDMKASLQFAVFGDSLLFFTQKGLSFEPEYVLHPTKNDLQVHFQGSTALVRFLDAQNVTRNLLFVGNHILNIPEGIIDSKIRNYRLDSDGVLVVNDKQVGKLSTLTDVPAKIRLGNQIVKAEKVQMPLKEASKATGENSQFVLADTLMAAPKANSATDSKSQEPSTSGQDLSEQWKESVAIAHAQGRKHISEVTATSQQDGKTVQAFDVVKNFITDLDVKYQKGSYTLDTDERVIEDNMITILHNQEIGNIKYVGPGGSGKSTSLKNLVYRRRDGDMIGQFNKAAFMELNLSAMNSSKYKGSEGASLNALIALAEAYKKAGQELVLVVDEAHTMKPSKSSDGGTDITQILKPYLANGIIRILGISTRAEWDHAFIQDVAFNSRFALVEKAEPHGPRLLKMLQGWAKSKGYIEPTQEVAELLVQLSNRFDPIGAQPRRAIRLMDTVYSHLTVHNQVRSPNKEDVFTVAAPFYNVDRAEFSDVERKKRIEELKGKLQERIVSQDQAKEAILIAEAVSVTGAGEEGKLQHRLLLTGPNGVGHSTLVKTLADVTKKKLNEIDLGQYTGPDGVARLQQVLAKAAQTSAIGILYFEHFEFASGPIQLMLNDILKTGTMQVMLDGGIQDFNLRNMTFIASTNLGSDYIQGLASPSDFSERSLREAVTEHLFAPMLAELEIVPLMPLGQDNSKVLVRRVVEELLLSQSSRETGRQVKISNLDAYIDAIVSRNNGNIDGSQIRRDANLELSKAVAGAKLARSEGNIEIEFKDGKLTSPHSHFDALKCMSSVKH